MLIEVGATVGVSVGVGIGTGTAVGIGHHPPGGSESRQRGVVSRQVGRGRQVGLGAGYTGHEANSQFGPVLLTYEPSGQSLASIVQVTDGVGGHAPTISPCSKCVSKTEASIVIS